VERLQRTKKLIEEMPEVMLDEETKSSGRHASRRPSRGGGSWAMALIGER